MSFLDEMATAEGGGVHRVAFGAGLSGWARHVRARSIALHTARTGQERARIHDVPNVCWCGLREPSFSHILWNCEETRVGVGANLLPRQPINRLEERLLMSAAPPMPNPPPRDVTAKTIAVRAVAAIVIDEMIKTSGSGGP